MKLNNIPHVFSFLSLCLALFACNDGTSGPELPVMVIDLTDGAVGDGCSQPLFPSEQPDLSIFDPPRFLLTTSQAQQTTSGQAIVRPGDPIEAEITVNAATRNVKIELVDVWQPLQVILVEEVETPGDRTIPLTLFSDQQDRGRFYMRLTLCGFDCNERHVLFEVIECPNQVVIDEPCAHNEPYRRTVVEDSEVVQVDNTCIDLGGRPGVGSGTISIQQ